MKRPDFAIAVGAAVTRQIGLSGTPTPFADTLIAYCGDEYLIVPNQSAIVEKAARRIVPINAVSA